MPSQQKLLRAGLHIEDAGGAVLAGGDDASSVGGELRGVDVIAMIADTAYQPAVARIPDRDSLAVPVGASPGRKNTDREHLASIGGEGAVRTERAIAAHKADLHRVGEPPFRSAEKASRGDIPELDQAAIGRCQQPCAIRAELGIVGTTRSDA